MFTVPALKLLPGLLVWLEKAENTPNAARLAVIPTTSSDSRSFCFLGTMELLFEWRVRGSDGRRVRADTPSEVRNGSRLLSDSQLSDLRTGRCAPTLHGLPRLSCRTP